MGLFVVKGSGSGIFPDPDPGDPKRPDPTGSATLIIVLLDDLDLNRAPKKLTSLLPMPLNKIGAKNG